MTETAAAAMAYGAPDDEVAPRTRAGTALVRSQLAALPRPQPLINGVMSTPAAVLLVGSYSIGKSALMDGIIGAVATGLPWLDHVVRQRRCLLIVGEGAYGKDVRLTAWEKCWNDGQPIGDNNLTLLVQPDSLRDVRTWIAIQTLAVDGGYGLVVFDTFSSLAPDADEVKDAPAIMRHLSDLVTAINGTGVLVHHPGWSDATRSRGGYQLEGNADEVLLLTGEPQSDLVCLTRKKVKDGPSGATLWLRRRPIHGSVVMEVARPDEIEAPIRDRVLLVLGNYGDTGATGPQLQTELGIDDTNRSGFYKALRAATDDHTITTAGGRGKARYYLPEHAPGGR